MKYAGEYFDRCVFILIDTERIAPSLVKDLKMRFSKSLKAERTRAANTSHSPNAVDGNPNTGFDRV